MQKVQPEDVLNHFKQMSSDFREMWLALNEVPRDISGWIGRHFLALRLMRAMFGLGVSNDIPLVLGQLSFIKRALPFPGPDVVSASLARHRVDMTSDFSTPQEHLDGLYDFGRWFANTFLLDSEAHPPFNLLVTSTSACYEKTRREGGLQAWAREALFADTDPFQGIVRPEGVLLQEFSDLISEGKVIAHALAEVQDPDFVLRSKVEVVAERGLKARVVTKSQGSVLVLGHLPRQRLIRGLKRVAECRGALGAFSDADLINQLGGCSGEIISSDLRAASDLLPRDGVTHLVEGLLSSGKFSDAEAMGLRLCSSNHELSYDVDEVVHQTRGLLMGLPTTWILLSLYHLYWWRSAKRKHPSVLSRYKVRAMICGDDLVAVAPPCILDQYELNMQACGGELSAGKHCRSKKRGVFLEKLLEFNHTDVVELVSVKQVFRRVRKNNVLVVERETQFYPHQVVPLVCAMVPLKGFFSDGAEAATRRLPVALPDWVVAGEVSEALRLQGVPAHQNFELVRTAFPKAVRQLRDHRIPPYLPRFLGGGGLVWRSGDDASVSRLASRGYRKALTSLLTDRSADRDPQCLGRMWTNTKERVYPMASQAADELLSRVDHALGDVPPEQGGPWFDCGVDFRKLVESRENQRLGLMMDLPLLRIRLGEVAKHLSRRVNDLSRKWESSQPWSKSVAATREVYEELVLQSRVWLPPSEDPTRPGTFGVSFWKDSQPTCQLRRLVISEMALPL
jgi:hypothetical protein